MTRQQQTAPLQLSELLIALPVKMEKVLAIKPITTNSVVEKNTEITSKLI